MIASPGRKHRGWLTRQVAGLGGRQAEGQESLP